VIGVQVRPGFVPFCLYVLSQLKSVCQFAEQQLV
jgi:hypothetical protein